MISNKWIILVVNPQQMPSWWGRSAAAHRWSGGRWRWKPPAVSAKHRWGPKLHLPTLRTNVLISWCFANQSLLLSWVSSSENWTGEICLSSVRVKTSVPASAATVFIPCKQTKSSCTHSNQVLCFFFLLDKKIRCDCQNLSMRSFTEWSVCLVFHSPAAGGRQVSRTLLKFRNFPRGVAQQDFLHSFHLNGLLLKILWNFPAFYWK